MGAYRINRKIICDDTEVFGEFCNVTQTNCHITVASGLIKNTVLLVL
jgi:hypothetical protein